MKWHHLKFLIANKGIYESADIKSKNGDNVAHILRFDGTFTMQWLSNSKQRRRQVHFMRVEDVVTGNKVENCKSSEGKVGANMSNFEFLAKCAIKVTTRNAQIKDSF
jgi:hypothetical protein